MFQEKKLIINVKEKTSQRAVELQNVGVAILQPKI